MDSEVDNRAKEMSGKNIYSAPILVNHADLERDDDRSVFKSVCPACEVGILMVERHKDTYNLQAIDRCILCGQTFVYKDLEELKMKVNEI